MLIVDDAPRVRLALSEALASGDLIVSSADSGATPDRPDDAEHAVFSPRRPPETLDEVVEYYRGRET